MYLCSVSFSSCIFLSRERTVVLKRNVLHERERNNTFECGTETTAIQISCSEWRELRFKRKRRILPYPSVAFERGNFNFLYPYSAFRTRIFINFNARFPEKYTVFRIFFFSFFFKDLIVSCSLTLVLNFTIRVSSS